MFQSDTYLIKLIVNDDNREAANSLVNSYYKYIYREIYRRTSDIEVTMDLTQETFITILKNLNQFNDRKASFKTWITRIAANKVIDYSRSRQYHEKTATQALEDYDKEDDIDIEIHITNKLAVERVKEYLVSEKEQDRQIFTMKAEQGYTFEEIAKMLGVSSVIAKNRYYSMIKRMRKELKDFE